jgi:AcrR family transcriptional regulator
LFLNSDWQRPLTIEYPKRALKKNINRAQIIHAAITLFAINGFQDTKLVDVANKAGVHVQTLYRHFKSKDDLAIAAANAVTDECREFFEAAPRGKSTFQIWRAFIRRTVVGLAPLGWQHKRRQLRSASSMMNDSFLLIVYSGYEDLLTEYLAGDFQLDPKLDRLPRQVAAFLCSSNEAAMKRCAGLDTGENVLDNLDAVLEESLGVIDDAEKIFSQFIKAPGLKRRERSE